MNGKHGRRATRIPIPRQQGAPSRRNNVEMIANRPTPDHGGHARSRRSPRPTSSSRTARSSSPPSPVARTRATPASCSAPGLLAKKAVERGLHVNPAVKTSLGPGSRVVSEYLNSTGLQPYLDKLGFQVVGYGCTTCIGNSGPLNRTIEDSITEHDLVTAAVLSGNRNFEARIHQNIKANFLMSPPLVVAFALAGRVDIDMDKEPIGKDKHGRGRLPARPLAQPRGSPRHDEERAFAGAVPQTLPRFRRPKPEVERNPLEDRRRLSMGPAERLHRRAAVLRRISRCSPRRCRPSTTRVRWGFSAIRSRPTTFPPPARSSRARPPANI